MEELKEVDDCSIEGTLMIVSPIKSTDKCSKFYSASIKLTDGKQMRVVSFNDYLHEPVKSAVRRRIQFDHIKIEKSKYGQKKLELHVKDETTLTLLDNLGEDEEGKIEDEECWLSIEEVKGKNVGENVNLKARILSRSGPKLVKIDDNQVKKVVCVIANGTNKMELVLWDNKGEDLEENTFVSFKNLVVAAYGGKKYVRYSAYTSGVKMDEAEKESSMPTTSQQYVTIEVVGIDKITMTKSCNACFMSFKNLQDKSIVECGECHAMIKANKLNSEIECNLRVQEEKSQSQRVLKIERKNVIKMLGGIIPQNLEEATSKLMAVDKITVAIHNGEIVDVKL